LLALRTPRRDRTRIRLQPSGGQSQHGFKECRGGCAPRRQHSVLVFGQALIAMCSRMFHQGTAELRKRLYDLIREVVGFHVTSPDPSLRLSTTGLFL
jgi:hypothetical protein